MMRPRRSTGRAIYWVVRRELHATVRAPIVYVIGGVFLAVQGIAFAALVAALSDPRRPAPIGALLEGQLAGTLLTWGLELVVLTLLGMRTIAEDKRNGSWEVLLTAGVSETAAVVGKWIAAVMLYALLWIPTLAYLVVVAVFRIDHGGWDLASIAVGYAGAIAVGAAMLAWAIAASAAMSSILGAGALGFALVIGWFLLGELPALSPSLAVDHSTMFAVLSRISLRGLVTGFARGELGLDALLVVVGGAITGLSAAVALACLGRRRDRELRIRTAGTVAIAVIVVLSTVLAARHAVRWDASDDRRNSLDPATVALAAELPPTAITIVRPTYAELEPVYDEVARVVSRIAELAPRVTVQRVDPVNAPGGLAAIARAAGLSPDDLGRGGSVVIDVAGRRKVIDVLQIATLDRDSSGAPVIEHLAIEQALTGSLAALVRSSPMTVCATTGHGELSLTSRDANAADWTVVADRLRADGITVEEVAITGAVPARCDVVVVAGPAAPLDPTAALALQQHVAAGHGLVVAAASRAISGGPGGPGGLGGQNGLVPTGLEAVLARDRLGLPAAIAIDPSLRVRELPGALLVANGYADHPINAGFQGARATLWFQPRVVITQLGATPLISATEASWGERDTVTAPPVQDGDDLAGPVVLAGLGSSGHVIALGSAESLSTALLSGGASAADLWLASAIRFVGGRPAPSVAIAARAPTQIRLVMTSAQQDIVIGLCAIGIPLAWVLVGGGLVWWRRRRAP